MSLENLNGARSREKRQTKRTNTLSSQKSMAKASHLLLPFLFWETVAGGEFSLKKMGDGSRLV